MKRNTFEHWTIWTGVVEIFLGQYLSCFSQKFHFSQQFLFFGQNFDFLSKMLTFIQNFNFDHNLFVYNSFSLLKNIKFLHIFRGFPHVHCIEKISTKYL